MNAVDLSVGSVQFQISLLAGLGLLLLAAICAWCITTSWRRLSNEPIWRRMGVAGLNLAASLALALLLVQPAIEKPADAEVVLLTEGFDLAAVPNSTLVYLAPGATVPEPRPQSFPARVQALRDLGQLSLRQVSVGSIHVFGEGLENELWQGLPPAVQLRFEARPLAGIDTPHWPREAWVGAQLALTGQVRAPGLAGKARLELLDPSDTVVASAEAADTESFALEFSPLAAGLAMYRLRSTLPGAEPLEEPVPVAIRQPQAPAVLVLQSAPSFETRQFVNWLTGQGGRALVLSTISRDRHLAQGFNLPADTPLRLEPEQLKTSDLALLDGRAWTALPETQRQWFRDAVAGGMGLLLLPDEELRTYLDSKPESLFAQLTWPQPAPATSATALTDIGQFGLGRVAFAPARDSHGQLTRGERSGYSAYWAELLASLARAPSGPRLLPPTGDRLDRERFRTRWCAAGDGRALELEVFSLKAATQQSGEPVSRLQLAADAGGTNTVCADFWPLTAGWYQLVLREPGSTVVLDSSHRHVFGAQAWRATRSLARQRATGAEALARSASATAGRVEAAAALARSPLAPVWAWWLLVLSAGLLWLERRLDPSAA